MDDNAINQKSGRAVIRETTGSTSAVHRAFQRPSQL